ncbi:MAG: RNA methyltransferase [Eubacteriales bacterium]|nr:RNA methyltransferase [Eubacteriales bacterium]
MANIIPVTDFDAPQLDVYARLTENQLLNRAEPEKGIFIAESPLVIGRALDAGCVPLSFLTDQEHLQAQAAELIARCPDVPVYTAPFAVLTRLTGFALTRGTLCAMRRPRQPSAARICSLSRRIAVLENVMNPTNVGAIFRSAAALSMDAVLLAPDCSNPLYRRAIRVSMGTVFQIPWAFWDGEEDWFTAGPSLLRRLGFTTAAMALREDSVSIGDPRLKTAEKLAVILGSEGEGLRSATIDACDYTVRIPMACGVDSLNVAAASAVAFWELTKQP